MKTRELKNLMIACAAAVVLSSCYSTTTCVGSMSADQSAVEKAKVRNNHFVYGLVSGKNAKLDDSKYVGSTRNYRVTKSTTFIDGLLSVITCGIYSPTTTTYYVQGQGGK